MLTSALLIAQLAAPAAGLQQTVAATQAPLVKPDGLPTVFLTDLRGVEHRGVLTRVDPAEVVLLGSEGERVFTRGDIVQIEKRGDSLKNGALIGALVGGVGAVFAVGLADCPGTEQDGCPGARAAMALLTTGIYTAIGVGIDAGIQGRTLIYRAPGLSLSVRPSGAGAAVTIRW